MSLYVLFEHAMGYSLFKIEEFEEIGSLLPEVEKSVNDSEKFKKIVKLAAFRAFKNAAASLENMNTISEGLLSDDLCAFLRTNLPLTGKTKVTLGVSDPKLGAAINEAFDISIKHTGAIPEIIRGIRIHLPKYIKNVSHSSIKQTELGLGHAYSRGKVKFNVNRVDNMIIQSIALVDQLDKDINVFTMRIREWYSYHFPELSKIITDNYQYVLCANTIKDKSTLSEDHREKLDEIIQDSDKTQAIYDASRMSIGMDISPIDLLNIEVFSKKVANLSEYRQKLANYLREKMNAVAPNLATLIGETVGARLISHAGSLTSLAKYPASTVQILGAEKALFRALKTRGNTPKYGLIFHSSFIGRAAMPNKGRISRYLANKCSLASRIDCFSDTLTNVFGTKLRDQVEERLKFYEFGDLPRKNLEVMSAAVAENSEVVKQMKMAAKKRKRESVLSEGSFVNGSPLEKTIDGETPNKKKKNKKAVEPQEPEEPVETMDVDVSQNKVEGSAKKKRRNKKKKQQQFGQSLEMSANASLLDAQVEEDEKVKEKKNGNESANVSIEEVPIAGEGVTKKKKKRKSKGVAGEK